MMANDANEPVARSFDSYSLLSDTTNYLRRQQGTGNRQVMTLAGFVRKPSPMADEVELFGCASETVVIDGTGVHFTWGGSFLVDSTGFTPVADTWYHVVVLIDTTQATATDRVRIFVNFVDVTDAGGTFPTLNYDTTWGLAGFDERRMVATGVWLVNELSRFDNVLWSANQLASPTFKPIDLELLYGSSGPESSWLRFELRDLGFGASAGYDWSGDGNEFTNTGFNDTSFSTVVP